MGVKDEVSPRDIRLTKYWDTFENDETERAAYWVVRFLIHRGKEWEPFFYEEIDGFYRENVRGKHFVFHRLVAGEHDTVTRRSFPYTERRSHRGYIDAIEENGTTKYVVQDEFVRRLRKWHIVVEVMEA